MGRIDDAWEWLQRAVRAGEKGEIVEMARNDPDLKPLWRELRKL